MYIQRQPSHILLSIIKVSENPEISNVIHEVLFELEKISDIIFIFPERAFLSKRKFTSLYQGCGWTSYTNLPETFVDILRYDKEIFEGHTGILYANLEDLGKTMISDIPRLPLILGSTVVSAVFEYSRLGTKEFKEIYELKEPTKISEIIMMWLTSERDEDTSGMYCIYKSTSPIMLFPKPALIDKILEGATKDYLETFRDFDLHYLLASLSVKVGIKILNKNFNELGI